MLVSAASSLLVVLASVPHVSGQAVSTTTSISTVTLPPGPTAAGGGAGDTMATVDVNGRIQFITQLTYNSLKDLSSHKIIAPNASSWFICSSTNAVMLDTPVPSTDTKKNGTTLAFMISAANKSESMLSGTMYPINSAYAGHTTTVFNWTDGTCVPGGGYFLAAVDKNCVENVDTPIQGCIWAISESFEYREAGKMPALPLPSVKENSARALAIPAAAYVGAFIAAAALIL